MLHYEKNNYPKLMCVVLFVDPKSYVARYELDENGFFSIKKHGGITQINILLSCAINVTSFFNISC